MANKDFKVKNGLDIASPLPVSMGGTGQTSTNNTLNALLPSQVGNSSKVLSTDGTNTSWVAQNIAYQRGDTASRPASPSVGDLYYNTQLNYFESYTSNGWFPIAAAPLAPTGVTATDQPSGRAYNNGQMSVAFTPNSSGGAPTSFTVTSSPGSYTNIGSSSPIVITGLQSSTQYTYTVTSTSPYGTSSASSASTAVTATTVPQAPTIGTATEGDSSATLTFTAGATGGSSITNYKYSTDGITYTAFSPAQTTSPLTISNLTNGTSYAFYLKAVNTNGDSTASSISNSITPASNSYESIATFSGTGSSGTISFNSIPQTYKHLQIVIYGSVSSSSQVAFLTTNNGTSTSYSYHSLSGDGASVSTPSLQATGDKIRVFGTTTASSSSYPFVSIVDLLDYTDTTKYKTFRTISGGDYNGSGEMTIYSGMNMVTNAINSITIYMSSGNFNTATQIALYGVKA